MASHPDRVSETASAASASSSLDGLEHTPCRSSASNTPILHRKVNHIHKLERKHSSGDLHSRLKTRKLLGVGETDDGDVHRSKLSQILGHSEQLYVKLPRGLRIWQILSAIMFSVVGFWALAHPKGLFKFAMSSDASNDVILPVRMYGAALLGFSVVFWGTIRSGDKDVIRWSLLASLLYFLAQVIVHAVSGPTHSITVMTGALQILLPMASAALSIYFYWSLSRHPYSGAHKVYDGWSQVRPLIVFRLFSFLLACFKTCTLL